MDDKSALIVDFEGCTVQVKSLLDLDEAALVTKTVEPFFLDTTNGNLYSWTATKASSFVTEESKSSEQANAIESRTMISLMAVPGHGQKLTDFAITRTTNSKPTFFFTNGKSTSMILETSIFVLLM